jgi:hypothetical protein
MAISHRLFSGLLERLEEFTGLKTFKQFPWPFCNLLVLYSAFSRTAVKNHEK